MNLDSAPGVNSEFADLYINYLNAWADNGTRAAQISFLRGGIADILESEDDLTWIVSVLTAGVSDLSGK